MASEDVVWEKQLTQVPDSKPRLSKRLRALRSRHGCPATDTEDEQPLLHRPPVDVEPVLSPAPSPPNEVIRALEEDLLDHPRAGKACRRVLVPEDSQGTPRSVQDREAPSSMPLSFPTSPGGAVRVGKDGMEELDLTRLDTTTDEEFPSQVAGPTQWESGADFSVGSRGAGLMPSVSPPTPVATVLSGSRFHCLAVGDSESDSESVPGIDRRTRRRLSLIWRADGHPVESVPSEDPAEEDDRDSVVSGEGSVESVEEEAMPFRLPGLRGRRCST